MTKSGAVYIRVHVAPLQRVIHENKSHAHAGGFELEAAQDSSREGKHFRQRHHRRTHSRVSQEIHSGRETKMNQRNLRGTGIRKLPSGRYQITFRDGNGVKHRESFDREKDARAAQDERRTSVRNREYVAPAKIPTVEQSRADMVGGQESFRIEARRTH